MLLLVSLAVRLPGADSAGEDANADETALVWNALRIATGDLDPHNFHYPSLFRYLLASAMLAAGHIGAWMGAFPQVPVRAAFVFSSSPFFAAARLVSELAGAALVMAIFEAGRRLFDARAGLLAALFLAFAPLHVEHSGWGTTDIAMTLFAFLSVAFACVAARETEEVPTRAYVAAGLFAGLAASTKYPGGLALVAIVGAHWLRSKESRRIRPLLLATFAAAVAFALTSPYAWIHPADFWRDYRATAASAQTFPLPEHQGPGWLFYLSRILGTGLLPVAGAFGLVGAVRGIVARDPASRILAGFSLGHVFLMGCFRTQAARYVLPAAPTFCLLAGSWLATAWGTARDKRLAMVCSTAVGGIALGAVMTGWMAVQTLSGSTRSQFIRHLQREVPAGSRILYEPQAGRIPSLERLQFELTIPEFADAGLRRQAIQIASKERIFHGQPLPEFTELYDWKRYEERLPDYVVTAADQMDRPGKFPDAPEGPGAFYRALRNRSTLAAQFAPSLLHRGPWIRLYRMNQARNAEECASDLAKSLAGLAADY